MMPAILLHGVAGALYAALAFYFWNTRWRVPGAAAASRGMRPWERVAILVALALHGSLLYADLFAAPRLRFGFAHALSTMFWLGLLVYWIENLFYSLEGVEPLLLLAGALTAPLPAFFPGLGSSSAHADSLELRIHLALAMVAYSLAVIAALHAALMALVERELHRPRTSPGAAGAGGTRGASFSGALSGPLGSLPPLLTLERLLFRVITLAFVFLTLTLATGIAFSETLFGRALRFDHKTVFAVLSWATFAALLAGRYLYGWRGRLALRGTLTGFVLLLLAYVGSRFVLEVVLGRS
jgi:ABC-type uncharacterized transport system permease subunit